MAKVVVEFINTCPCCDAHARDIQKAAAQWSDQVEVVLYQAGKDMGYVRKYGMVSKGTMIINGKKKYDQLSPGMIQKAIEEAVHGAE